VYGRVSAQWASKNLDSSQKFGLGGPNGVRAYPSGEGYGGAPRSEPHDSQPMAWANVGYRF